MVTIVKGSRTHETYNYYYQGDKYICSVWGKIGAINKLDFDDSTSSISLYILPIQTAAMHNVDKVILDDFDCKGIEIEVTLVDVLPASQLKNKKYPMEVVKPKPTT